MEKRQKILLVALIGGILLVLLVIGILFSRKNKSTLSPKTQPSTDSSVLLNKEQAEIDFTSLDPSRTKLVYFNTTTKQFEQLSPSSGAQTALSSSTNARILQVFWSPRKLRAIVVTEPPTQRPTSAQFLINPAAASAVASWLVDFTSGTTKELDPRIVNLTWAPDGEHIAYQLATDDGVFIATARPDGTQAQPVVRLSDDLGSLLLSLYWSGPDEITILRPPLHSDDRLSSAEDLTSVLYTVKLGSKELIKNTLQPDPADLALLTDGSLISISKETATFTIQSFTSRTIEGLVPSGQLISTFDGKTLYFLDQDPTVPSTGTLTSVNLIDTKSPAVPIAVLRGEEFRAIYATKKEILVVVDGAIIKAALP